MRKLHHFLLVLCLLFLVGLACNIYRQPTPSSSPVPVTTEAVRQLEENIGNALQESQASGNVSLTVTEEQLTSAAAFELQEQGQTSLTSPQIYLRDGQIQMYGTVMIEQVSTQAVLILAAEPDANGKVNFSIISGTLGPLPLPEAILQEMETNLDAVFSQQLEALAPNTFVESILIANGEMQISGHTR
jgi:uncharacterized protein YpmS